MTLKLELPPDLEERLQAEAAQRGVPVEQCARLLLQAQLALVEKSTLDVHSPGNSPEERLRAFDELVDFINNLNIQAPPIPSEALRRENLYEDRGL